MSRVIIVDTRKRFLAELATCCKSMDAEITQVVNPTALKDLKQALHDTVVALWIDCPPVQGVNIAQFVMRAIAASRLSIPVVLYGSRRDAFTNFLEPGMPYPHLALSAHACAVAGIIQRVCRQKQSQRQQVQAFEDWACQNHVSIAGTPGRVSVVTSDGTGGFTPIGAPQNPLAAVGSLLTAPSEVQQAEPLFY
jgi:hypothetical protein